MQLLIIIFEIVGVYLATGFVFMIPFVVKGVNKIDEGAHGSSIGFRIVIIPGVIIFWPVLLRKWLRANAREHRPA